MAKTIWCVFYAPQCRIKVRNWVSFSETAWQTDEQTGGHRTTYGANTKLYITVQGELKVLSTKPKAMPNIAAFTVANVGDLIIWLIQNKTYR